MSIAHVAPAPRVESVVDEGAPFEQPVIVLLDAQTSHTDRLEPGAQGIRVSILAHIRGMHDLREPYQRRITAQVELLDERLEAALRAPVRVLRALGVERM